MSAFNPWKALKALIASPSLQVGIVIAVDGDVATVELPGGGKLNARGSATVAASVFVRDGVIEGEAPSLPVTVIDI